VQNKLKLFVHYISQGNYDEAFCSLLANLKVGVKHSSLLEEYCYSFASECCFGSHHRAYDLGMEIVDTFQKEQKGLWNTEGFAVQFSILVNTIFFNVTSSSLRQELLSGEDSFYWREIANYYSIEANKTPREVDSCFTSLYQYSSQVVHFCDAYPQFCQFINLQTKRCEIARFKKSFWPLLFSENKQELNLNFSEKNSIVLFLEESGFTPFECSENQSVYLVFSSLVSFSRHLCNVKNVGFFLKNNVYILLLDRYLVPQLYFQGHSMNPVENIFFVNRFYSPQLALHQEELEGVFSETMKSIPNKFWKETSSANELCVLGQTLSYRKESSRLTPENVFYLQNETIHLMRRDPYQIISKKRDDFYKEMIDDQKEFFKNISLPKRRELDVKKSYNIAHIIPNIVDKVGHAPTNRLIEILENYNRDDFNPSVWLSEQDCDDQTAQKSFSKLKKMGIPMFFPSKELSVLNHAKEFVKQLEGKEIDILVLHEPFVIHLFIQHMTKVPLILFMEHGYYSFHTPLDALITSHHGQAERIAPLFERKGVEVIANPKILNISKSLIKENIVRQRFAVDSDTQIFMSVSNRLDASLSPAMCLAVKDILLRCPKSIYLIAGNFFYDPSWRLQIFEEYNLKHRVIFLGYSNNVKELLSGCDVYLNPFPMGGGCSIMEALACKVPVVSMFFPSWDSCAQEGADFVGLENTIYSQNPQDYVEMAVKLAKDSILKEEFTKRMHANLLERGSAKDYNKRHHEIIRKMIQKNLSQRLIQIN
jgi:glycosyltransferase involved in cell wall biosynthesis